MNGSTSSGGGRREAKMLTRTITLGLQVHWTIVFEKEGVREQVGTNRYYQSSHIGRKGEAWGQKRQVVHIAEGCLE